MYILGLESSCDETSAAIVRMEDDPGTGKSERTICANIVASQIETHRLYGGVVPEIAGRAHIEAVSRVTYEALREASLDIRDIGAVAVTTHPGLIGALLVGVNFAKSLAFAQNIPLVSVNHIHAHVAAAYLTDPELKPPFLALVVSGGHTQLYMVEDALTFRIIGGTRDDAAGEAFDKIGRVIGLPYPGGSALDKLAYEGNPDAFTLPSPALTGEGVDFSFSGLKTATLNLINAARQRGEELSHADLAASYTATIVRGLTRQTMAAIKRTGATTLVLAGGVAANSHLRKALAIECEKRRVKLVTPPLSLCGDNGAMVAAAGYFRYQAGLFADTDLNASAADEM
jgi:N6-L-threonylcarbamoyladenine synthase